jgi:hypothetical protein
MEQQVYNDNLALHIDEQSYGVSKQPLYSRSHYANEQYREKFVIWQKGNNYASILSYLLTQLQLHLLQLYDNHL